MKFLSKDPPSYDSEPSNSRRGADEHAELNAFLGQGCTYSGKLTFEGAVRIDGRFSGEITSKGTLIIGEHAEIKATINVAEAIISGKVKGDVRASKRLELRAPARLMGNVSSPSLKIQEGVFFEGQCRMSPEVADEPAPRPKKRRPAMDLETLGPPKYESIA